jgi:hypothetical protein
MQAQSDQYFDLAQLPLFTTLLLRLEDARYVLGITINHTISDAWSVQVLENELGELYQAYREGRRAALAPLHLQAKDYAVWEQGLIGGSAGDRHRQYWYEKLSGPLPYFGLSAYFKGDPSPGARHTSYRRSIREGCAALADAPFGQYEAMLGTVTRTAPTAAGGYRVVIDADLLARIHQFGHAANATPFEVLLAGFHLMLYRLTANADVVVGVLVAQREHNAFRDVVGWFMNTLLYRTRIDEDHSVTQLLAALRDTSLGALQHQVYPFEQLLEALDVSVDAIGAVRLNYINYNVARRIGPVQPGHLQGNFRANFNLECSLTEYSDGVEITCMYNADLFTADTVALFFRHFSEVLGGMLEAPGRKVRDLLAAPAHG